MKHSEVEIANALIGAGAKQRAKKVLTQALSNAQLSKTGDVLLSIGQGFAEIGDFEQANRTIDMARQAPQTTSSEPLFVPLVPKRSPFADFFSVRLVLHQNLQQLQQQLQQQTRPIPRPAIPQPATPPQLKQSKPVVNPPSHGSPADWRIESNRILFQQQLAEAYAIAQNFTEALAVLNQIPNQYCQLKIRTLNKIVEAAVAAENTYIIPDELEKIIRSSRFTNTGELGVARSNLIGVARLYSRLGQSDKAVRLLQSALKLVGP